MTTSPVYFTDLHTTIEHNLTVKTTRLLKRSGLGTCVCPGDLTAIKLHFGEAGNTAFIRPIFIRWIVDAVAALGAKPFLTDANTLYRGDRSDAVSHILRALKHGFDCFSAGAPVIIADGLRGTDAQRIAFNGTHYKELSFGSAVIAADSMVNVSHFKGHELTGFGGALKNLGMGCASREGKMSQHATISPRVEIAAMHRVRTLHCNLPGSGNQAQEPKSRRLIETGLYRMRRMHYRLPRRRDKNQLE